MGKPLTTTSCDQGIDPATKNLTYLGRRLEGDPKGIEFYIYEFTDARGVLYCYTQRTRRSISMFSGVCDHLRKGDPVEVNARFGCCSYTYRKAPHHIDEEWLKKAMHFVRPQMKRAPKKRARNMRSWEQDNVGSWSGRA